MDEIGAWLHLTDSCNLKCKYCHFPHNPLDMHIDIALSSIETIFRVANRERASRVHIKYMGGEPLLQYNNIITISNYAKKIAKESDIELDELIVTNGLLLDTQKIKKIKELDIKLTISLDGIGRYNAQRADILSTNRIMDAINLSIKNGLLPNISVVVNEKNIDGLAQLVSWILKRGLRFNLILVRNSLFYQDKFLEQKIIDGLLKTFETIEENLPKYNIINSMFERLTPLNAHSKTCGAGENYLVFDPRGEIAKCQMEMHNIVANYQDNDPIKKIQEDTKFVKSYDVDEIEECNECDIRYFCTGGCPMQTYYSVGRYNQKSPNCNIYKAIYPALLRLEGIRILIED